MKMNWRFYADVIGWVVAILLAGDLLIEALNRPVLHCKELVAMSRDCIPFGCSKTYVNERGEDTGECR